MKKEYSFKNGKRGRVISQKGKKRVTMYLDTDILDEFRSRADKAGYGYQTMINEALKKYLQKTERPIDETLIRQVIREELEKVAPL